MTNSLFDMSLSAHLELFSTMQTLRPAVEAAAERMKAALAAGSKVLVAGNGGSAADAQHFAAELVGRFQKERQAMAAVALTTDTSILTALANDYSFDIVFSRQIDALVRAGDLVVGISTSGNSRNVLLAIEEAKRKGMACVGMTAEGGGKMAGACDICLAIPAKVTARAQEMHIMIGHILCEIAEEDM